MICCLETADLHRAPSFTSVCVLQFFYLFFLFNFFLFCFLKIFFFFFRPFICSCFSSARLPQFNPRCLYKGALFPLNPSPGVSVRRRRTRRLPLEQAMRAAALRAARGRLARAGERAGAEWREGVPCVHGVCFSPERRLDRRSGLPIPHAQC